MTVETLEVMVEDTETHTTIHCASFMWFRALFIKLDPFQADTWPG